MPLTQSYFLNHNEYSYKALLKSTKPYSLKQAPILTIYAQLFHLDSLYPTELIKTVNRRKFFDVKSEWSQWVRWHRIVVNI